mmetsp:Transcript_86618/g.242641  ORF Transcript_86618/g.242641 Transcript_86618/m.242641 type:complete len:217 (-) Transcript_86618:321-971(-)
MTPLFSAQLTMDLSLSSVYWGLFSKNQSSQSNVPSSGRQTGKRTSCLPSLGGGVGATALASLCAESCHIRHLKGKGANGDGPKLQWTAQFLKVNAGYNALPLKLFGNCCGSDKRWPSLKRLTVLAFGASSLPTLSTIAKTWSRPIFFASRTWTFRLSCTNMPPSISKQTFCSVSPRNNEPPATESPTRNKFLARFLFAACCSVPGRRSSTIFTSNM